MVCIGGGVCSSGFDFIAGHIRHSTKPHANWNCDEAYAVPADDVVYRDETVVFGGCLINHFGHALLEGTSRLWYLPQAPDDAKIVFLRYPRATNTPFDALKFVELMGFDMGRVEVIDEPTRFHEIIVPDEAIYALNAFRPEYILAYDRIRENIRPHADTKVYLSRRRFKYRTSLNEEHYEEFFARRGFTVIYPETLTIEEQIAYIAGADEVVSMMGSMAHLLLFAKPTVKATILNRSGQCLTAQIIVDQARGIEPYYIDAYLNPLPVPHVNGPFLFGPNRFFQAYLDERGIAYEPDELRISGDKLCSMIGTFTEEWAKLYCNPDKSLSPGKYRRKDIFRYGEDYMQLVAELVGDDVDDPDDFLFTQTLRARNAEIRKLKANNAKLSAALQKSRDEVKHLRNSKSWKITAPLRKIVGLFGGD